MRFVIDTQNAIGIAGLGFFCGIGWSAGCWAWSKLTSALKI